MEIILREFGGLGNQLFRYAALRYYAKRYDADMKISVDPEWNAVSFGFPRPCLFSHYSIPVPMEERTLSDRLLVTDKPWLQTASRPIKKALRTQVFTQHPSVRYSFEPDVPLKKNVKTLYLVGYWHTHVMVEAVAQELRAELKLKEPAQGKNLEILKQINSTESVAIHVRRGDCVNPETLRNELPITYYLDAIMMFEQELIDPTFFVFSDDTEFVKNYLPPNINAVYVDHNDDFSAHEDMRLMSACQHQIIANSTFSWWAGWLNPRADKIVVAPRHWDVTADSYYPDLLPNSWTLTDVVGAA
jgi:hypothetical protein